VQAEKRGVVYERALGHGDQLQALPEGYRHIGDRLMPPEPRQKVCHRAQLLSHRGVSALCFKRPRSIDLRRAMWTNRDEAVTCKKCLAIIAERTD
jgi:hypothetical protein